MVRAKLRRSRYLAAAFTVVHAATAATIAPLDVAIEVKLFIALAIVVSLGHVLHRHALLMSSASVRELEVHDREHASIRSKDGRWRDAQILGTTYVSPLMTVINLRMGKWKWTRHVIVVGDNMDAEDFRQVRVILRWCHAKHREIA